MTIEEQSLRRHGPRVIPTLSLLAVGYVTFLALIWRHPLLQAIFTLAFAAIMGLLLHSFASTPRPSQQRRGGSLWTLLVLVAAGLLAIRLAAMAVMAAPLSVTDKLVPGLAAVCESWFVHAGFQDAIRSVTGSDAAAILIAPGFACLLHSMVYGTSVPLLLYVYASFLILCTVYWLSGDRIEVPLAIHLLINVW